MKMDRRAIWHYGGQPQQNTITKFSVPVTHRYAISLMKIVSASFLLTK
jgi:hypothetical protein